MNTPAPEIKTAAATQPVESPATPHPRHPVVLEITVRDHPGVMSHVCGLFARRAFNVDAILCLPLGDGRSRIWLRVDENGRTEQVEKQLRRLEDVIDIAHHAAGPEVFTRLRKIFETP